MRSFDPPASRVAACPRRVRALSARVSSAVGRSASRWAPLLASCLTCAVAGCALPPTPGGTPAPAAAASAAATPASAARAPCAPVPAQRLPAAADASVPPDAAALSMPVIESMLRRVATFDPAAAEARQRYLQALGKLRNPAERLELAYLLLGAHREALTASGSGGAGGTNGSGGSGGSGVAPGAGSAAAPATQARELLKGLDAWTGDAASRQFVRLVQALAQRSAELAQTRSALGKAQRKAADLEDKIGQIKNLEVQLQGRSQDRNAVRARPDR